MFDSMFFFPGIFKISPGVNAISRGFQGQNFFLGFFRHLQGFQGSLAILQNFLYCYQLYQFLIIASFSKSMLIRLLKNKLKWGKIRSKLNYRVKLQSEKNYNIPFSYVAMFCKKEKNNAFKQFSQDKFSKCSHQLLLWTNRFMCDI